MTHATEQIQSDRPLIIAHRGASADAPENTLAAFRLALDALSEGVEFDVRLAKDGIPVVFHDETLKRVGGLPERVDALTSNELSRIDVGSWFNERHPRLARPDFSSETVPTLASVLELLPGFRGLIYIELKSDEQDPTELAAAVSEVIRRSPLMPQLIVTSFRLKAIGELKSFVPEIRTAALFSPQIRDYLRRRRYMIPLAHEFGATHLSLHHTLVSEKLVSLASAAGMPVTVWTCDKPKWIHRCQKIGVAALITNKPAEMLARRARSMTG